MMMGTGTSSSSLRPVDGFLPLRLMECLGKQVERGDTTELSFQQQHTIAECFSQILPFLWSIFPLQTGLDSDDIFWGALAVCPESACGSYPIL